MLKSGKYIIDISDSYTNPEWDRFLSTQYGGVLEQTSIWAKAKSIYGWQSIRVIIKHHNEIIAGFQLLKRRVLGVGHIAYISKGPVFSKKDNNELKLLVLEQIKKITRCNHIHILIVHPPVHDDLLVHSMISIGFKPTMLVGVMRATLLIDLSKNIEEILGQMKAQMRKEIRQGLRKGIKIRSGTEKDISKFFNLMLMTCKRQGVKPNPPDEEFFKELWHTLGPFGEIKLFLAEYKNEIVAGSWIIAFGNIARGWKVGWSGRHGDLKPNQLLVWEAIKWAKAQGYSYFDFVGVSESAAEKLKANISMSEKDVDSISWHKSRYGGKPVLYPPAYEYIYNPLLRFIFKQDLPRLIRTLKTTRVFNTLNR